MIKSSIVFGKKSKKSTFYKEKKGVILLPLLLGIYYGFWALTADFLSAFDLTVQIQFLGFRYPEIFIPNLKLRFRKVGSIHSPTLKVLAIATLPSLKRRVPSSE